MNQARCVAIAILMVFSGLATAGGRPGYYPPSFPLAGVASEVDTLRGRLIVNDLLLYIDSSTEVHSPRQRRASLVDLHKGDLLGVRYGKNDKGQLRAEEIWILPDMGWALPPPP